MYKQTVPVFIKLLDNVTHWLDKAESHAVARKCETSAYVHASLIADQYPLNEQIQSVCDAAKFCTARLIGKDAPKHEDNETTFDELRQRITKCVTYLKTIKAEDFKGCEDRPITLSYMEGKTFKGEYYANHMAIPNFYFHLVTTYSILRSNGVDVGKVDFIGTLESGQL